MLGEAREFLQDLSNKQSPDRWASDFSILLKIFAWPDERQTNSYEYQIIQAWQGMIG